MNLYVLSTFNVVDMYGSERIVIARSDEEAAALAKKQINKEDIEAGYEPGFTTLFDPICLQENIELMIDPIFF